MQLMLLLGTLILGALALFSMGFWTTGLVEGVRQNRQQTLDRSLVSLLELRGFYATIILLATPILPLALLDLAHIRPDRLLEGSILQATLILLGGCVILWSLTLYLRFRAKRPSYVYLLPGAADQVRIQGCLYGILLAVQGHPRVIQDRDWIDLFARSIVVGSRVDALPVLKRQRYQLTNDFLVFCNLTAEGFITGYYRCAQQCHADPDRLEAFRAQIQAFPQSQEASRFLRQAAQEMLSEEEA